MQPKINKLKNTHTFLKNEERWSLNGSLNDYTILQLELFCHRKRKTKVVPYVQAFMKLRYKQSEKLGTKLG